MENEKNTIWQEIFADYRKSELSQRAYCKENNLKYSTFAYWRNRLSKRAKEQFVEIPIVKSDVKEDNLFLNLSMDSNGEITIRIKAK
ncbi:MAG: hypothetical protein OEZ13_07525 [Spirochaetia bacterium]|nr:hypothetical protein [Spirochaetia bacterium]